jgi:hypothetical protein
VRALRLLPERLPHLPPPGARGRLPARPARPHARRGRGPAGPRTTRRSTSTSTSASAAARASRSARPACHYGFLLERARDTMAAAKGVPSRGACSSPHTRAASSRSSRGLSAAARVRTRALPRPPAARTASPARASAWPCWPRPAPGPGPPQRRPRGGGSAPGNDVRDRRGRRTQLDRTGPAGHGGRPVPAADVATLPERAFADPHALMAAYPRATGASRTRAYGGCRGVGSGHDGAHAPPGGRAAGLRAGVAVRAGERGDGARAGGERLRGGARCRASGAAARWTRTRAGWRRRRCWRGRTSRRSRRRAWMSWW